MMDLKPLRAIGNGIPVDKAVKLGIDYRSLISSGMIKRVIKKESKFLVPEHAPRWAIKYKFLRRRHGIEESTAEVSILVLTEKAKKLLKSKRKDEDEEESKPPTKKEVVADEPVED